MTIVGADVLGPVRITRDGVEVDLGTHRHRQVVAALVLAGGHPVTSAVLIQRVWGEHPPATALATLHGYVAALRRLLEPDRAPRSPATVLTTVGDAYALRVTAGERDDVRFEELVRRARQRLTVVGDHLRPRVAHADRELVEVALDELDDALGSWRGSPYVELGDDPTAAAYRTRLEDGRRMALELRAVGQLALGRHDVARAELEMRTAENPLHERWWALRAVALARESRQADALAVLDELRAALTDQLGVDLSPPLQELRTAILRQDSSVIEASGTSAASRPVRQANTRVRSSAWQLLGRDSELTALRRALDRADRGHPTFAGLSGPPGIGKSRLIEEIALEATGRGWQIAVGQCTQEAGAPPLWPWLSVLDALSTPFDLPAPGLEAGGAFQVRADLVEAVRTTASQTPFLLVLEDLHWADASTLAVLKLLVQSVDVAQLLVIATWRPTEQSRSDVNEVAEAFARRHAVRLDLEPLRQDAASSLFESVSGLKVPADHAAQLHNRTGGLPFFVVELARQAAETGNALDQVLGTTVPSTVVDVLGQRLAALPESTRGVLRAAAVLGHSFDLETLGDITRIPPDDLLDSLEPALSAGVVAEERPEVLRFSHALVAEVLMASMSATRLARTHQLVAEILERRPGREAEVARHWRAAGPRHIDRAWRALSAAAEVAASFYAYVDAAELLDSALALQAADPDAGPTEQLTLLKQARDACRWAAMRPELIALVEQSISVARGIGDVRRLAEAATDNSTMLWRSAPDGEVNEVVVDALRYGLDALPRDERALRSRILAALPIELYDVADLAERQRLSDESIEHARELDDAALLCDVLQQAAISTWAPSTAELRLAAAEESVELARAAGRAHPLAMSLTLLTNVYSELGRPASMRCTAKMAREVAAELKVVYVELVLDVIELAWAASAGQTDLCDQLLAGARERLALLGAEVDDDRLVFSSLNLFAMPLWRDRPTEDVPELAEMEPGAPTDVLVALVYARAGLRDRAARFFDADRLHGVLDREDELSCPLWCATAEMALHFDAADLAGDVQRRLEPYAGRASGSDGLAFGPVDAFLALAARAAGDVPTARSHADAAMKLIDDWDLPPVRQWLERLRRDFAF